LFSGQLSAADGAVGAEIRGTFEYDTDAVVTFSSAGRSDYSPALSAISIEFNSGLRFDPIGETLRVTDRSRAVDQVFLSAVLDNVPAALPYVFFRAVIDFNDNTGRTLNSSALPTEFRLDDWSNNRITLNAAAIPISRGDQVIADFTVVQPVTAIPLPAALPLFFTGFAGLGFMRRRRAAG